MSIFPILLSCIPATHLGRDRDVPVIRTPLVAPFGTTDYSEIPAIYAREYAAQILKLADEYDKKVEK